MTPLASLFLSLLILGGLSWFFWPGTGLLATWQRARKLSSRVLAEDALKHLFSSELENRHPTLQSIAGTLSVSHNEAAEIVSDLEQLGHAVVNAGELQLTATGREYALRIIRAHRLWERYLSDKTGHAEVDWHDIAEQQEHQLSPEQIDALASSLGNPTHDPHGDPIPTADGKYAEPVGHPLTSLKANDTARITHMEDEPAVIYSQLIAEGLHTGMILRVLEVTPERVRFWANSDEHVLAPLLANNISVVQVSTETPLTEPNVPLTELSMGATSKIVTIAPGIRGAERRRLMDLGMLPGTDITAELRSPSGDPTGYIVRGTLIALRADQAQHIKIATNGQSS
jgi:DtxR family Mn-dependent transcriptional regulator